VYRALERLRAWGIYTAGFDCRVDLYSLGVVLFKMPAGTAPYRLLDIGDNNLHAPVAKEAGAVEEEGPEAVLRRLLVLDL
jgi:hypothetical protein